MLSLLVLQLKGSNLQVGAASFELVELNYQEEYYESTALGSNSSSKLQLQESENMHVR